MPYVVLDLWNWQKGKAFTVSILKILLEIKIKHVQSIFQLLQISTPISSSFDFKIQSDFLSRPYLQTTRSYNLLDDLIVWQNEGEVNLEFAIDEHEYLRDRQLLVSWQLTKSEIVICKNYKGRHRWGMNWGYSLYIIQLQDILVIFINIIYCFIRLNSTKCQRNT